MKILPVLALCMWPITATAQDRPAAPPISRTVPEDFLVKVPISVVLSSRKTDAELIGNWQYKVEFEGKEELGFASFAKTCALLSNSTGDRPFYFTYGVHLEGNLRRIMITPQSDKDATEIQLYGCYWFEGKTMTMAFGELRETEKMPNAIEEVPVSWTKTVFTRAANK